MSTQHHEGAINDDQRVNVIVLGQYWLIAVQCATSYTFLFSVYNGAKLCPNNSVIITKFVLSHANFRQRLPLTDYLNLRF